MAQVTPLLPEKSSLAELVHRDEPPPLDHENIRGADYYH